MFRWYLPEQVHRAIEMCVENECQGLHVHSVYVLEFALTSSVQILDLLAGGTYFLFVPIKNAVLTARVLCAVGSKVWKA